MSVEALDAAQHRGDRLTLGAVRERTAAYTSYDVAYRSITVDARGEKEIYRDLRMKLFIDPVELKAEH